jgi:hypothetical protein
MGEDAQATRRPNADSLIVGVLLGVALAVPTAVFPISGLPIVAGLLLVLASTLVARPVALGRLASIAGVLIGAGLLYLYGVANTVAACWQTADFCGQANVLPLLGLALSLILVGTLIGTATLRARTAPRGGLR